jgi:hypothetical protein
MILDSLLRFTGGTTGVGNSDGLTDSPTTGSSQVSSNILDLGISGLPASAQGGGARDIGVGDDPMLKIMVLVTTAFSGGGTALQIAVAGAPDNGSGLPGSYTIMALGPNVLVAQLVAGARICEIDVPRPAPNQALPRFLELQYIIASSTFTAGKIQAYIVVDRHDQPTAGPGVLSGYQPGITVAN